MNTYALVLVAALALTAVSSNGEMVFRRATADVSAMQDNIDALTEDLTNQGNRIDLVSTLADNLASQSDYNSVVDDVRFLIERSLAFADGDDLVALTSAMTAAASTAQKLRAESVTFQAALPGIQSVANRALHSALDEHNVHYEQNLATSDSLETRLTTLREQMESAERGIHNSELDLSSLVGLNSDIKELNTFLEPALEGFEKFEVADKESLFTMMNNMLKYTEISATHSRWWWQTWSTYSQRYGWEAGNSPAFFGGVHPSNWGDSNYHTGHMSKDMDVLRTLFTRRGYGGWNANIFTREWYYYSSTNSMQTGVLFRFKNTLDSNVFWFPYFAYSSYGGWGETASISLNGNSVWSTTGSCYTNCNYGGSGIAIPANSISTIIIVVGSGPPSSTRAHGLGFYNNCLNLPRGLLWEDDLTLAEKIHQPL